MSFDVVLLHKVSSSKRGQNLSKIANMVEASAGSQGLVNSVNYLVLTRVYLVLLKSAGTVLNTLWQDAAFFPLLIFDLDWHLWRCFLKYLSVLKICVCLNEVNLIFFKFVLAIACYIVRNSSQKKYIFQTF